MAPKLESFAKTLIHVPDTSVIITIYLNDLLLSMCDTRLTSYTFSLLIDVAVCSIEGLNVLNFFQIFFNHVCLSNLTDGQTVGLKWLTGCGGLASYIFFFCHGSQNT